MLTYGTMFNFVNCERAKEKVVSDVSAGEAYLSIPGTCGHPPL